MRLLLSSNSSCSFQCSVYSEARYGLSPGLTAGGANFYFKETKHVVSTTLWTNSWKFSHSCGTHAITSAPLLALPDTLLLTLSLLGFNCLLHVAVKLRLICFVKKAHRQVKVKPFNHSTPTKSIQKQIRDISQHTVLPRATTDKCTKPYGYASSNRETVYLFICSCQNAVISHRHPDVGQVSHTTNAHNNTS